MNITPFSISDHIKDWRLKDLLEKSYDSDFSGHYGSKFYLYYVGLITRVISEDEESEFMDYPLPQALTLMGITEEMAITYGDYFYSDFVDQPYYARSGEKYVSPYLRGLVAKCLNRDVDDLSVLDEEYIPENVINWEKLSQSVFIDFNNRYGKSVLKMAQAYFGESYNPLENYRMEQVETPNITREKTGEAEETENPNISKSLSRSTSKNESGETSEFGDNAESTKVKNSTEKHESVYGFNSEDSVPVSDGDSESTTEGKDTDNASTYNRNSATSGSGSESESVSETESGSRRKAGSSTETETETGTRVLTRSGNIGITTSQQMLESELQLRKFDFMEYLFKCFDEMLVCACY